MVSETEQADGSSAVPRYGRPVPFLPAMVVALAVLTYVFGWSVLLIAVALVTVAIIATLVRARRRQLPPESDSGADVATVCERCGGELFHVVYGRTSPEEIQRFARDAEGWSQNPDALAGWMPSGVFCKLGCTAIHTTPALDPLEIARATLPPEFGRKLTSFTDLYERALQSRPHDVYVREQELTDLYRSRGRQFLASMPMRHRVRCPECDETMGEIELHYEVPRVSTTRRPDGSILWGEPAGAWVVIHSSVLHGVLKHGRVAPRELLDFAIELELHHDR